jgi:uncharacterized protein YdcH (DUF465 family)
MYENRIKHLKELHRILDNKIAEHEKNHPHSQENLLHEMKKQKLIYKDEIAKLEQLNSKSS